MTQTQQHYISVEVRKALSRAGVDHNAPIRRVLEQECEVSGVRDATVRARGDISLDARIDELRRDPRYASSFPSSKPTIARTDMRRMSENISEIADGSIRVE